MEQLHRLSNKPLVSIDIEGALGRDAGSDRIVSIGLVKILPPLPLLQHPGGFERRRWVVDPNVLMPDEVIAVHGITNEYAAGCKPFDVYAREIQEFIDGCAVLIGFDLINYDVPLLWEEFHRAGIEWDTSEIRLIDAAIIFKKKEERSLSAARRFYCAKDHTEAHNALADAEVAAEVLNAQLERYSDLAAMSIEELSEFSRHEKRLDLHGKIVEGPDGRPTYTLRRVRGVAVEDDQSFAYWMLDRDFPVHTKKVLRQLLGGDDSSDESTLFENPDPIDTLHDAESPFLKDV